MKKILDDIFNLGFLDGLAQFRCITTLSLIQHLSEFVELFDKNEGLDLMVEYESGFQEGAFAREQNLLKEGK